MCPYSKIAKSDKSLHPKDWHTPDLLTSLILKKVYSI